MHFLTFEIAFLIFIIGLLFILTKAVRALLKIRDNDNREKFLVQNYSDLEAVALKVLSDAYEHIERSTILKNSVEFKPADDELKGEICAEFIQRFFTICGEERKRLIIDRLYGDMDTFMVNAIKYFYDRFFASALYKKTLEEKR